MAAALCGCRGALGVGNPTAFGSHLQIQVSLGSSLPSTALPWAAVSSAALSVSMEMAARAAGFHQNRIKTQFCPKWIILLSFLSFFLLYYAVHRWGWTYFNDLDLLSRISVEMSSRSRCFHVAGMPPDSDNTHPVPLVPFPEPPSSALLSITVQLPVGSKQKGQHPQARKGRDLHSSPRLLCYCLKCSKVTRKERGPLQGGGDTQTLSLGASKLAPLAVFVLLFQVWAGFASPLTVTAPEPSCTVPASGAAPSPRTAGSRKACRKFVRSRKADSTERVRKGVREELTSPMQRAGARLGT